MQTQITTRIVSLRYISYGSAVAIQWCAIRPPATCWRMNKQENLLSLFLLSGHASNSASVTVPRRTREETAEQPEPPTPIFLGPESP